MLVTIPWRLLRYRYRNTFNSWQGQPAHECWIVSSKLRLSIRINQLINRFIRPISMVFPIWNSMLEVCYEWRSAASAAVALFSSRFRNNSFNNSHLSELEKAFKFEFHTYLTELVRWWSRGDCFSFVLSSPSSLRYVFSTYICDRDRQFVNVNKNENTHSVWSCRYQ